MFPLLNKVFNINLLLWFERLLCLVLNKYLAIHQSNDYMVNLALLRDLAIKVQMKCLLDWTASFFLEWFNGFCLLIKVGKFILLDIGILSQVK